MTEAAQHLVEMLQATDGFPDQLLEGVTRARKTGFLPGTPPFVLSVGMGGSAIAGDLLAALAAQIGRVPILPVRAAELPSWAGPGSLAIFTSHSGNTDETLTAFESARVRGFHRVVVSSGGKLLELARQQGIPAIEVPAGLPPRASLGYQFGALYGLLLPCFPGGEEALTRTLDHLRDIRSQLKSREGPSLRVAEAWKGRELWVYVPDRLAPVGRRWTTQASENAKRLAHFDTLTEAMHNAIVGWDQATVEEATRKRVVILFGESEPPLVQSRIRFLSEMVRKRGTEPLLIRLSSADPLGQLLEGVWIGDYATLLETDMTGVDPVPVDAIDRMKAGLPP